MDETETNLQKLEEIDFILSEAEMQLLYEDFFASDEDNHFKDFDQLVFGDDFNIKDLPEIDSPQIGAVPGEVPATFQLDYKRFDITNDLPDVSEVTGENMLSPVLNSNESTDLQVTKSTTDENITNETSDFVTMCYVPPLNMNYNVQSSRPVSNNIARSKKIRQAKFDPRKSSILKPISDFETYSKIPDYYKSIAPQLEVSNDVDGTYKENMYDKLPSYLTEFISCKPTQDSGSKQKAQTFRQDSSKISENLKNQNEFIPER